jgi:hypothetical protein
MKSWASGWLCAIPAAMVCSTVVLPALAGATTSALAEAQRCDEVDEATGHVALPARCLGAFEEHPARVHRGQPVEVGSAPGLLGDAR